MQKCTRRSPRTRVQQLLAIGLMALPAATCLAQLPYQSDIDRWKSQDALDAPAANSILFVGSSSIRRWEDLKHDFSDYNVIQRGFGGSTFSDLNNYVSDIVLPYNPRAIVLWEGTNDINAGDTGSQVYDRYQTFINTVTASQPNVDIFYIGITKTPGTSGDAWKTTQRLSANSLISNYINTSGNAHLHYVDMPAAFESMTSTQLSAAYVDTLHLNRASYNSIWSPIVRSAVQSVIAPNRTFTLNPNSPQAGKSILFDFGPGDSTNGDRTVSTDTNGNHWNNWYSVNGGSTINAGEHVANLVDTTGAATGINLTITGGFSTNGKANGGLLSPKTSLLGDLAVATATEDYFYSTADGLTGGGSDDVPGSFMLDGLDPSLSYNFKFLGSRLATDSRSTTFDVRGANSGSATLQTSGNNIGSDGAYDGNDSVLAIVNGIQPNAFGEIYIDLTAMQTTNTYAYINAMEVTAVPEPATGILMATGLGFLFCTRRTRRS